MNQGGEANAERVADICFRAHRLLAAGKLLLEHSEPCHCFYGDGLPRFTGPTGKPVHRCGR